MAAKPVCLAELYGHSDAVNSMLALSETSLVSCGSDKLLMIWKDGLVESQLQNEALQRLMAAYDPVEESTEAEDQ